MTESIRSVAFHLPQFHAIPENDEWWGKGFTEWTNVAKAKPLFAGHDQPQLPADLGFYDLRLTEAREAQSSLAREYGIHGFCYYHYWFHGRRLLERPVNEILASGQPNFPFCLCWANESWSRRWDGLERQLLVEQNYSVEDDLNHIRALIPAFKDPRYIRVNDRPVFLVYRASKLPNAAATADRWRTEVKRAGLPDIYLINVEGFPDEHGLAPKIDFNAAVEFAPDWTCLPERKWRQRHHRWLYRLGLSRGAGVRHNIYDYDEVVARMLAKPQVDYLRFPGVTPAWDNSARRKEGATILTGATPEKYGRWLDTAVKQFQAPTPQENFIFINAWNEWAEGNHLEPCQKWGRAYLEATRKVLG